MLLNVKPGVPCKLRRVDGDPGYLWDGDNVIYPTGNKVPLSVVLRNSWEILSEPKFKVGDRVTLKWEGSQNVLRRFCFFDKDPVFFGPVATVVEVGEWSGVPGIPAIRVRFSERITVWIPEAACELYKEPTVEEYVKSRGFFLACGGTQIRTATDRYPSVDTEAEKFTLETAKLACDLLEKLK